MTIIWSHPTWNLFHITTANMVEESFDEKLKNECIDLFTKICNAIPCMFCRVHAAEHMKTINRDEIKTARDLELFFWKFHNEVNERSKKEVFPEEKLVTYKQKNINRIKNEFKDVLYMYYRNEELSNEFNTFMKQNKDKFIHFNEVKQERKDANDKKDKKKDKKDRKDAKDKKDKKERKDAKDKKERKDKKDAKDKKEKKDAKDTKEKKDRKDAKDKKERKDAKDKKERKDAKDKKDKKERKDKK
jgi:hypothetical protein